MQLFFDRRIFKLFFFFLLLLMVFFLAVRIWVLRVKMFVFCWYFDSWIRIRIWDAKMFRIRILSTAFLYILVLSSQLIFFFFISERHRVHFEILHRELHTRFSCTPYTKTKNLRKIIKNAHTCTLKAAGNLFIFFNDKL